MKIDEIKSVEWVYDWYNMICNDNKVFIVSPDFATKFKLVPWDILKLKILRDWKLIYEIIKKVNRKYFIWVVSKTEDNKYIAITKDGLKFYLNIAAVVHFNIKIWDEILLVTNSNVKWNYAAVEKIIKKNEDI